MLNLYPAKYPLVKQLNTIKVPIIFLAIGWYGFPGDSLTVNEYKFTNSTQLLFQRIKNENNYLSVRDIASKMVLINNNFQNVINTGCTALFDLKKINNKFNILNFDNIVFTTPANKHLFKQAKMVLTFLLKKYKMSQIVCSFHRGIDRSNINDKLLIDFCLKNKIKIIDVSGKFKENLYDNFNFHIGYRVHGHYYFLSKKKYSILIEEDGRAVSANLTYKTPSIKAFKRTKIGIFLSVLFRNYYLSDKLHKMGFLVTKNKKIIEDLNIIFKKINFEELFNFQVDNEIHKRYKKMINFIENLP